jgi:hypothetical protein
MAQSPLLPRLYGDNPVFQLCSPYYRSKRV